MASLGTNPTFVEGSRLVLEVHVLDFDGDLYDRCVRTAFVAHLRDEAKFASVDALVTPTAPSAAFAQGEKMDDPVRMYFNDVFTVPGSMSGIPGISVPTGLDAQGLPLGLQVLGKPFDEECVFAVGAALERAAGFDAMPSIRAGA